jgi:hypothetical protein
LRNVISITVDRTCERARLFELQGYETASIFPSLSHLYLHLHHKPLIIMMIKHDKPEQRIHIVTSSLRIAEPRTPRIAEAAARPFLVLP